VTNKEICHKEHTFLTGRNIHRLTGIEFFFIITINLTAGGVNISLLPQLPQLRRQVLVCYSYDELMNEHYIWILLKGVLKLSKIDTVLRQKISKTLEMIKNLSKYGRKCSLKTNTFTS